MTEEQHISKAFTTGYRFEEFYPGLIHQTIPGNCELSVVLSALKKGAYQHTLDVEYDRLKALEKTRQSDRSSDLDIEH